MYQVFDPELFRTPSRSVADDDFAQQQLQQQQQQRCRDTNSDGIDEVLNWLGLQPGGQVYAMGEDPGGGWTMRGTGRGERGLGQLMEMDSDEIDYDYSCLSSGIMSPDLDSEFFGMASVVRTMARSGAVPPSYPWEFTSANPGGILANLPDRPPSPFFRFDSDFRFQGMENDPPFLIADVSPSTQCDLDPDAAAKVKEIARYLASFEVNSMPMQAQPSQSCNSKLPGSNPVFPLSEQIPVTCSTQNPLQGNHPSNSKNAKQVTDSCWSLFQSGYDDFSCGLENTMVNPNEVFPDRIEKSDHLYASRANHEPSRSRPTSDGHSQRSASEAVKGRGSVLEALLRTTEPIDPNKGSGAALAFDPEVDMECPKEVKHADRKTPERMLKKLLTGRIKADELNRIYRNGTDYKSDGKGAGKIKTEEAKNYSTLSPVEREYVSSRGGQMHGFAEVSPETEIGNDREMSSQLSEILREQTIRQEDMLWRHFGISAS